MAKQRGYHLNPPPPPPPPLHPSPSLTHTCTNPHGQHEPTHNIFLVNTHPIQYSSFIHTPHPAPIPPVHPLSHTRFSYVLPQTYIFIMCGFALSKAETASQQDRVESLVYRVSVNCGFLTDTPRKSDTDSNIKDVSMLCREL